MEGGEFRDREASYGKTVLVRTYEAQVGHKDTGEVTTDHRWRDGAMELLLNSESDSRIFLQEDDIRRPGGDH